MDPKRKRVLISLPEKLAALRRVDQGLSYNKVAVEMGVSESTVRDWQHHRVEIETWCSEVNHSNMGCRVRMVMGVNQDLEEALYTWFNENRLRGIPLSGPLVKAQALKFYEEMGGAEDFQASNGWLRNFKQRYGIRKMAVRGINRAGGGAAAKNFTAELMNTVNIEQLTPDQVFNCDETGLYLKRLPAKTSTSSSLDSLNDRVTVLACANASGSLKMKLMVVGKSGKPKALRHMNASELPVYYRSQTSGWMDSNIFKEWFHAEFVPRVCYFLQVKGLPAKAVLLVKKAQAHSFREELTSDNVKTVFFPANSTSLIQPMDQGVIEALKRKYRMKLMTHVATAINGSPDVARHLKNVTISDAFFWLADAWDNVTPGAIERSWRKVWPGRNVPEFDGNEMTMTREEESIREDFLRAVRGVEGCEDADDADLEHWMVNDNVTEPMPSNAELISISRGNARKDEQLFVAGPTLSEQLLTSKRAKMMYDQVLRHVENEMELPKEDFMALQSIRDRFTFAYMAKKRIKQLARSGN